MTEWLSRAFSSLMSLFPIQYDDDTEIDPMELDVRANKLNFQSPRAILKL
jgi:hypothetical protein